jgi:transposase
MRRTVGRPTGRPPRDLAATLAGIEWKLDTGAAWRDVPPRFGHWNSVYRYWARKLRGLDGGEKRRVA